MSNTLSICSSFLRSSHPLQRVLFRITLSLVIVLSTSTLARAYYYDDETNRSYELIEGSEGISDISLRFGQTLGKYLTYYRDEGFFEFDDDLKILGNLDVKGTASGYALTVSGLRNCDTIDSNAQGVLSCGTDDGGGSGASDTGNFVDSNPAAFTDSNTTELFNDATKPNIVTDATTSTVLVSVHMQGNTSNTASDAFLASRIVYTTDGSDPACNSSTQLGVPMIGGFTTATTHPWQVSGTFLHAPGVAGTIKYTVCTSTVSTGTATDTPEAIHVSLVELGE